MAEVKEAEAQEAKKPARKRSTKKTAAETAEKAAVDVVTESDTQEQEAAPEAETAAPADGVTESDTQEAEAVPEPKPEPVERFCYMGPTLRKYGLIENMIYTGTASQLAALTEPAKAAYPEIDKLIFPAKDFQRVKLEKASGSNYVSRLYNKIKQM